MTCEEEDYHLVKSWLKFVQENYYDQVKKSFEEALKIATDEGIEELSCAVFRLPFHLDYAKIIDFNPEFYEFFKKVNPNQLKGIIREGTLPHFQHCVECLGLEGVIIDPRQISIDVVIDYIPAVFHNYLRGNHFYRCAIPTIHSSETDGNLESSWESGILILEGRICELSDPIYINDIQSFLCSNGKCRNNNKIIRFVGFDFYEQPTELAVTEGGGRAEIFKPPNESFLRCENCREEVHKLPAFRSFLQFRVASIKTDSIFTIDVLVCGQSGNDIRVGQEGSFFGFPAKNYELPFELQFLRSQLKSFYFESYGFAELKKDQPLTIPQTFLGIPDLTTLIELLFFQTVGNANGLGFDVILVGFDERILKKIIDFYQFASPPLTSKTRKLRITQQKELVECECAPWGKLVTFLTVPCKNRPSDNSLLIRTEESHEAFLRLCPSPIVLLAELDGETICALLLEDWGEVEPPSVPFAAEEPEMSAAAITLLQEHFVCIRQHLDIELFHLKILCQFSKISAIINGRSSCLQQDAQKAIQLLDWCLNLSSLSAPPVNDFLISPSVSFNTSFK